MHKKLRTIRDFHSILSLGAQKGESTVALCQKRIFFTVDHYGKKLYNNYDCEQPIY